MTPDLQVSTLVGLWSLRADGEPADAVLRLDAYGLTVLRPCGMIGGSWRAASDGTFVASIHSKSGSCETPARLEPDSLPWLAQASRVRPLGRGFELLSPSGEVTARLGSGARSPQLPSSIASSAGEHPDLSPTKRAELEAGPAPLPGGRQPVTVQALIGTWVAPGYPSSFVSFEENGLYRGSDGCNRSVGRWAVSSAGEVLLTSGISTLMLCPGVDVPRLVGSAPRVVVDGQRLLLLDDAGRVSQVLQSRR